MKRKINKKLKSAKKTRLNKFQNTKKRGGGPMEFISRKVIEPVRNRVKAIKESFNRERVHPDMMGDYRRPLKPNVLTIENGRSLHGVSTTNHVGNNPNFNPNFNPNNALKVVDYTQLTILERRAEEARAARERERERTKTEYLAEQAAIARARAIAAIARARASARARARAIAEIARAREIAREIARARAEKNESSA
jgi:hypothetical protein